MPSSQSHPHERLAYIAQKRGRTGAVRCPTSVVESVCQLLQPLVARTIGEHEHQVHDEDGNGVGQHRAVVGRVAQGSRAYRRWELRNAA